MHIQSNFDSFSFDSRLIEALRDSGVLTPTSLQRAAFEPLVEGRDLALEASSGTGRTLAWCLPLVQRLLVAQSGGRVVIVVPDNEAAMKVDSEIRRLAHVAELNVLMPTAGVERSGANYELFESDGDLPDILLGRAPSLRHFIDGTDFPLGGVLGFVVSLTSPLDPMDRASIEDLMRRLPDECQRIAVAVDPDDMGAILETGMLRGPAMVFGTSGTTGKAPVEQPEQPVQPPKPEPEPEPERRPPARTRGSRTRHVRKSSTADPGKWPIAHIGITSASGVTADNLARIVKLERQGRTVVIVSTEDRAREVARLVTDLNPGLSVDVQSGSDSLDEATNPSITVVHGSLGGKLALCANVLVLEQFPASPDAYMSLIPMIRCEPGDRIVSIVSPRNVSTQYQLRLTSGIRLLERRMPSEIEVASSEQADLLATIEDLAGAASAADVALLERIATMQHGQKILAVALRRLVAHGGQGEAGAPGGSDGGGSEVESVKRSRSSARRRRSKSREAAKKTASDDRPLIKGADKSLPERGVGRRGGVPMVEIEMSCGRESGVESEYIAQWLQSRLAMRVSELGPIAVEKTTTRITVPHDRSEEAMRMLADLTFDQCKPQVSLVGGAERTRS